MNTQLYSTLLARNVDSDSEVEEQIVDQRFHQSVPVQVNELLNGKQQRRLQTRVRLAYTGYTVYMYALCLFLHSTVVSDLK